MREIVVDPHSGRWYTVGDRGAEFVNIPKNAIVFNHVQSKHLLENGYVSGRASALVNGTALVSGKFEYKVPSSSQSSTPSVPSYTGSTTTTTGGTTKKSDTDTGKTTKKVKDLFDFIEIRLSRLQRKIDKYKTNAENIFKSFKQRNTALDNQIKQITTTIKAQEKAYTKYMNTASNVKLSKSLKKKVRNGSIDLKKYNDDTQEKIKQYQDFYEKALDAKDAVRELKQQLAEANKSKFDLIVEKWANKLKKLVHEAERASSKIDRLNNYASDHVSTEESNNATRDTIGINRNLISNAQEQISKKETERAKLINQLNASLADPNSGIKEGTAAYYEMLDAIYAVENEIDTLNNDIIGFSNAISDAYMKMFDNVASEYDNKMALVSHLASEYEIALKKAEAQGLIATESYYKNMQQIESSNLALLQEELTALQERKREALESGEISIGSNDYYEMTQKINDVSEAIMNAELNLIEFNNSIRDVKWQQFEYMRSAVSDLNDEIDFLTKLVSDKELFDDKGNFTNEGLTTLGLYGTSYNVLMAEADKYGEAIKELNNEIANDPANTKLIEQQKTLLKNQQDLILSANDQKQAIIDLVESGIEKELSSMKELIDSYTDALDRQKDLYDFQKKVQEQAKNIAELEKQLSAYSNDISEETRTKIQKIKVELESAREDLEETQYEYMISEQKKMLDEMYNEFEKTLNSRLDNVDALLEDMITTANKNATIINDTLQTVTKEVGYTMTEEMNSIWSEAAASNGAIQSAISTYGEQFSENQTATNSALNRIELKIGTMIEEAERKAAEEAARIEAEKRAQEEADRVAAEEGEGKGTKDDAKNATTYVPPVVETPKEPEKTNTNTNKTNNKTDDAKKTTTTTNTSKGTQGDGKVQVGDKVKFASGSYHAASDGSGASGNQYKNKNVYITKINSGAKYPYHISTGKKLGNGDLGWLKKSQISGYASGLKRANKEEDAWVDELGTEMILRPSENSVLTRIKPGDSVLNAEAVENMWKLATDPSSYLSNLSFPLVDNYGKSTIPNLTNNFDNINFNLPGVTNYEEFLYKIQHDKNAEKLINSMIAGRLSKRQSSKYNMNF